MLRLYLQEFYLEVSDQLQFPSETLRDRDSAHCQVKVCTGRNQKLEGVREKETYRWP